MTAMAAAPARSADRSRPASPLAGPRIVLLQTQAEAAGAQEISSPHALVCFQHYGNIIGALAGRIAGTRLVIVNRNSARALVPAWMRGLDLLLGLGGFFQAVVVNSGSVEKEYRSYPARYRRMVSRIDHGFAVKPTALTRPEARRLLGLPPDAVLLGSAARLHPLKNLGAAIRLLPGRRWHLAIAGEGSARAQLLDLAQSLGVADRLHLVGELPASRIGDFLGALDVFVFPSRAETFGLAVVEAAQAGVPVVANDLEVLREVLAVDGEPCALFVDVDDTEGFAQRIDHLLEDGELRARLRARAARLAERYSAEVMITRYAALIESTGGRRHSTAPQMTAREHVSPVERSP